MNVSTLRLTLDLFAMDSTGGALGGFAQGLIGIITQALLLADVLEALDPAMATLLGTAVLSAGAFGLFAAGLGYAVEAGAQLQQASVMASIAISDGAQHVGELTAAIVNLANTSQYQIADVDQAFRVLGGLGFDTGQILGGMAQQAIILAEALGGPAAGVSAADAARLLGQAMLLFASEGLTAKQAADALTGAFYNNMMSVSDLTEFLGMAGGTASSLGVSFQQLMTFGSMLTPMFGSASSAGASLSYMMRNLAKPATAAMAAEIQTLGLHVYDSQGKFVGLKNIMDQLFQDTAHMTQQQKMDVFGTLFNVRSGRAAMDLMSQTQASFDAEYNKVYGRINQVGQAQRDASAINNSTIGTWTRLTTTVHDFFAKAGEGIGTSLIPLMNALNRFFSMMQAHPGITQFIAIVLVLGTVVFGLVAVITVAIVAIGLIGAALGTVAIPILLIMAGLLVLVVIIALVIVNWNRLKDVAGQVWNWIVTQVERAVSFIGTQLHDLWTTVQSVFNDIKTGIETALTFIQTTVHTVISDVVNFFTNGIHGIGDLFGWLYNHNYYWADLVNDIRNLVQGCVNFLHAAWTLATADIALAWATIKNDATSAWNLIRNLIQVDVTFIEGVIRAAWSIIQNEARAAWNTFVSIIQTAGASIRNAVQNDFNAVINFVRNVVGSELFQAGLHLMQMLAQGIMNGAGQVLGAAKNVAGGIASFLGFHSPTEQGPGSTADQWMPALITMLTTGLNNGVPQIQGAANRVAGALGVMSTPGIAGAQGLGVGAASGAPQQYTVNMQVDGKTLAQTFYEVVNGQLRQSGYTRINR